MLPLLPDAQRALEMAADQEKDEDDDEEIDGHEGRPLRVYDHRLQCEDCGALGSVGCRACKDNRVEVGLPVQHMHVPAYMIQKAARLPRK